MKKRSVAIVLVAAIAVISTACSAMNVKENEPPEQTNDDLISEGEDTRCEVVYKPYSGGFSSMFLSEGDRIAVISPSALPSREQTDAVIEGLRKWG